MGGGLDGRLKHLSTLIKEGFEKYNSTLYVLFAEVSISLFVQSDVKGSLFIWDQALDETWQIFSSRLWVGVLFSNSGFL